MWPCITFWYCFLFMGCTSVHAQDDDYVVTHDRDTIWGSVIHSVFTFRPYLQLRTNDPREKIHFKEVLAYKVRNKEYMYVRRIAANGDTVIHHCRVMEKGAMTLLAETGDSPYFYFVYYENRFYSLHKRHLSNAVWDILTRCRNFRERYGNYKSEVQHKEVLFFPKQLKVWMEMVRWFNEGCVC